MFNLGTRLKSAFKPRLHDATLSHYIPTPQYSADPVELSAWRSDLNLPVEDWRGNTGRVYDHQVLTSQGPLLTALQASILCGTGGTGIAFGQGYAIPVAGFAGRPAQLQSTDLSAEWEDVQT